MNRVYHIVAAAGLHVFYTAPQVKAMMIILTPPKRWSTLWVQTEVRRRYKPGPAAPGTGGFWAIGSFRYAPPLIT